MPIQVRMLEDVYGPSGALLAKASVQTLDDEFALQLVGSVPPRAVRRTAGGLGQPSPSVDLPLDKLVQILSAGTPSTSDTGWLPIAPWAERLLHTLDSGSAATQYAIDFSADGVNSLGQHSTWTWSSSSAYERTWPLTFDNPQARFFRVTVLSGGPLNVWRNA